MTRKEAILAILSLPLAGFVRAEAATRLKPEPAVLTIDLDSWYEIHVKRGGKTITIPADEIFRALGGK